jgi:competence protein ComEA
MDNPLDFSKRTRRAILIFILLVSIVVIIPRFLTLFYPNEKFVFNQTDFEHKEFKQKPKNYKKDYQKRNKFLKFKTPPKKFNPNNYTAQDWMNLGLSNKQADLILKFGKRGFYSHEDLKRVFVISEPFFNVIKDSLQYEERPKWENNYDKKTEAKKINIIELNSANEEELTQIKGIGSFFAKNIIKYRTQLGGFTSKIQLLEVWKMDQEKYDLLENFIKVDEELITKLQLNSVTVEDLKVHPYITWNVANSIVKLRTQMGGFSSIDDVKRSVLIDEELFKKIKPYITL